MTLVAAVVVALAGCSDSQNGGPTGVEARPDLLELTDPSSTEGFVTTGGVDVTFVDEGMPTLTDVGISTDVHQHLSYDAKLANNTFQGEFQAQVIVGNVFASLHGRIECYVILGNIARVVGLVTNSSVLGLENTFVEWTSQDNGEGSQSDPDKQSAITPVATGCVVPAKPDLFDVRTGNIQIHPGESSQ
jgi:hypothetical protein